VGVGICLLLRGVGSGFFKVFFFLVFQCSCGVRRRKGKKVVW
jgi:hypothetical protein